MNNFVSGFEKRAARLPAGESTLVKFFRSGAIDPLIRSVLNDGIKLNQQDQDSRVKIRYKKKSTNHTVTREVTPYTAMKPKDSKHYNLLVGFDHRKNDVRSFLTDRMVDVQRLSEKTAFKKMKPRGSCKNSEIERVRRMEAKGETPTTPIQAGRSYPLVDYPRYWP
jgi:predicted DNA-binding transcriptional regulator YafY